MSVQVRQGNHQKTAWGQWRSLCLARFEGLCALFGTTHTLSSRKTSELQRQISPHQSVKRGCAEVYEGVIHFAALVFGKRKKKLAKCVLFLSKRHVETQKCLRSQVSCIDNTNCTYTKCKVTVAVQLVITCLYFNTSVLDKHQLFVATPTHILYAGKSHTHSKARWCGFACVHCCVATHLVHNL